jgi:predicted nucleic acid-binding Zn ribbon protein
VAHCSACGSQLNEGAQFCSGCGRPVTALAIPDPRPKRHPILWTFAAILVAAAIVRVASVRNDSPPGNAATSASPSNNSAKKLPARDAAYLRASFKYLKSANDSGTQMAQILAAASDGTSSLEDCHAALLRTLADETRNYSQYETTGGTVPPAFAKIDRQISDNHRKTASALRTTLSYWQNGNLASIQRGMDAYKAAVLQANAITSAISQTMEEEAQ